MDDVHGLSSSSLALLALRGCPRGWRGARLKLESFLNFSQSVNVKMELGTP